MSKEMLSRHKEGFWQAYFFENPFVLKVLFGLPVVMYTSQASVGRMGPGRTGEKYADYLLEAGMSGNLAIVEIKTTETPLLTELDQQRSFEIFRGSQRDVLVITFRELLAKLKALHEFLITKPGSQNLLEFLSSTTLFIFVANRCGPPVAD
ncbi:hypothetical protein [Mesorhizobium sp. M0701]|uniref:hypothetical protein n=1 Tax=Mesorhizobium sp. M0701 TaxID=2956989 RepID=UPI0033354009